MFVVEMNVKEVIVFGLVFCATMCDGEFGDARDLTFRDYIVDVQDIYHTRNSYVHVAMIITNILGKSTDVNFTKESYFEGEKPKLILTLQTMFQTLLKHSTGTPLHFIIFTEEHSRPFITRTIKEEIGRYLSEIVIRNHFVSNIHLAYKIPKIRVEYVNLESMANKYREDIDEMKKYYGHHFPEGTFFLPEDGKGPVMIPNLKYTLDLFYVVPFYHKEISAEIEKIIVIDIDLEFRIDMLNLYKHFKKFTETEMIGVANDLTPHYFNLAKSYRKLNPETNIGSPGRSQGFNTGVILYHLGKMRKSPIYAKEAKVNRITELAKKYMIVGAVGDQDWLTVLGWERPELFYLLPCEYNVQVHEGYNTEEWSELWPLYRNCSKPEDKDTKIIHRNGSW